jgi:signal transduction histidine kinase
MTLRLRFLLSLLAVLALMAAPAFYAASRVTQLRDMVIDLRGQAARSALAVGRIEAALVEVDRYQRAFVVEAGEEVANRMHASLRDARAEVAVLHVAGHGDLAFDIGQNLFTLAGAMAGLEALVHTGDLEAATSYMLTETLPAVAAARAAVPPLAAAIDARISEGVPVAQRSAASAATAARAAVLLALALAGALALAAAGVVTRPLDRLRRSMARVAEGSFDAPSDLPYDREDEVGDLARSFRTMTMRLAELDRLKAEFVGMASHDLKTPISIIGGYAELMQEELSGPAHRRHREMLRSLAEQTVTLQRRVDQLLELSRMEAGRARLGLEEIDLRHFAEELHRAYWPAARMRGIMLELHVHSAAPAHVVVDPDILRSDVLGNLLGNALKFTPAGGVIRLAFKPDGHRVEIVVADTGPGIDTDQLDRIFEKYYQGRGGAGGAGLGLAIARAGVEAHSGRIDVWSRVGQGSRFRVILPIRAVEGAYPVAPPSHDNVTDIASRIAAAGA